MAEILRKTRKAEAAESKWASFGSSAMILMLGTVLGIFSKWLDDLALDSSIWWHRFLEWSDLGNVFSDFAVWLVLALAIAVFSRTALKAAVNTFLFFLSMCIAYHLYTVFFSGFDPSQYMMIWYVITLFSPLPASVCWYGKGTAVISIVIDALILSILASCCFSIGWFYFGFRDFIHSTLFAAAVIVLYCSPKQIAIAAAAAIALSFLISPIVAF